MIYSEIIDDIPKEIKVGDKVKCLNYSWDQDCIEEYNEKLSNAPYGIVEYIKLQTRYIFSGEEKLMFMVYCSAGMRYFDITELELVT